MAQYEDIEIHLYEATAYFKDIGAGIGIWGRGITALRRWNLEEKARKIATVEPGKYDGMIPISRIKKACTQKYHLLLLGVKFELRRSDQPVGKLMGYWQMSCEGYFPTGVLCSA